MGKHHCLFNQFDSFQVNRNLEPHYIHRYLWMDHIHLEEKMLHSDVPLLKETE